MNKGGRERQKARMILKSIAHRKLVKVKVKVKKELKIEEKLMTNKTFVIKIVSKIGIKRGKQRKDGGEV